jgi:hypothetical protein
MQATDTSYYSVVQNVLTQHRECDWLAGWLLWPLVVVACGGCWLLGCCVFCHCFVCLLSLAWVVVAVVAVGLAGWLAGLKFYTCLTANSK